ncbi:SCO3870 family protein [Streptomyces afghaniensis]|uniref:SCO3870 family protein n=1 Tax=Streptomyces afghaniensis TaxID=66865 RepID=UPI00379FA510
MYVTAALVVVTWVRDGRPHSNSQEFSADQRGRQLKSWPPPGRACSPGWTVLRQGRCREGFGLARAAQ